MSFIPAVIAINKQIVSTADDTNIFDTGSNDPDLVDFKNFPCPGFRLYDFDRWKDRWKVIDPRGATTYINSNAANRIMQSSIVSHGLIHARCVWVKTENNHYVPMPDTCDDYKVAYTKTQYSTNWDRAVKDSPAPQLGDSVMLYGASSSVIYGGDITVYHETDFIKVSESEHRLRTNIYKNATLIIDGENMHYGQNIDLIVKGDTECNLSDSDMIVLANTKLTNILPLAPLNESSKAYGYRKSNAYTKLANRNVCHVSRTSTKPKYRLTELSKLDLDAIALIAVKRNEDTLVIKQIHNTYYTGLKDLVISDIDAMIAGKPVTLTYSGKHKLDISKAKYFALVKQLNTTSYI